MVFLLAVIYLSFISLGLPDALLGAAWPNMYPQFQVPVSYAGIISMKDKVGDACRAYWLVVQHSSVEMQRKYLPLFLKAAERGDIPVSYTHLHQRHRPILYNPGI